jgi:hypothetical protein
MKIIFKETSNDYRIDYSSDESSDVLAMFLYSDVGSRVDTWKQWISDPMTTSGGSNATIICKLPNNKIEIGFMWKDGDGPYFIIDRDKLIKLLDNWARLLKEKPDEIIITINDTDEVLIEGMTKH